jgi:hypothetical protein
MVMTTHQTNVEMSRSVPQELEAGADIILKVKVSCPEGCDLRGIPVRVMEADEIIVTRELATHDETVNETDDFAGKAPAQVGQHAWTILFPRHEVDDAVHEESSLVVSFTTRPHTTSMAVWDVPSPVATNRLFKVKVGVKCSAMCQLAGQLIEVCDEAGIQIADGRLGETPWPGTSALYVGEVELTAPATEGISAWSARFPPQRGCRDGVPNASRRDGGFQGLRPTRWGPRVGGPGAAAEPGLPHEKASATFSFRTARPPEYQVSVRVIDKETGTPLENVDVRLGVYRASTAAQGLASLEVPGGVYNLEAWKVGYETPSTTVEVGKDLMIQIAAVFSPEQDPDDERVWM